jgi:hypothetical protein
VIVDIADWPLIDHTSDGDCVIAGKVMRKTRGRSLPNPDKMPQRTSVMRAADTIVQSTRQQAFDVISGSAQSCAASSKRWCTERTGADMHSAYRSASRSSRVNKTVSAADPIATTTREGKKALFAEDQKQLQRQSRLEKCDDTGPRPETGDRVTSR